MRKKFLYIAASAAVLACALWIVWNRAPEVDLKMKQVKEAAQEQETSEGTAEEGERESFGEEREKALYKGGLPVVKITVDRGQNPMLRTPLWAKMELYENEKDSSPQEIDIKMWIRGQSSATYPKKQYGIDVYEAYQNDKTRDVSVLGMPEDSDWVLNGPYYDRSLLRNALMYGISRELMDWAPDTRFCEAWVNGRYQGLFVMTESVKVSKNRLDLYDYGFSTGETGYLLLRDRASKDMTGIEPFGTQSGKVTGSVYVKYPKEEKITDRQLKWIEDDISRFERLLYMDGDSPAYLDEIDLDSFVDYYILNEFSMNRDAGSYSTYCYRDMKGKLCMGPVWDFNNTFNNYVEILPTDGFIVSVNNWFRELLEDRIFVDAVVKRYRELRRGVLSEESLYGRIDTYLEIIGGAIRRDRERWPRVATKDGRKFETYEENLDFLKTCIHDRGEWMDKKIEKLYYYCR